MGFGSQSTDEFAIGVGGFTAAGAGGLGGVGGGGSTGLGSGSRWVGVGGLGSGSGGGDGGGDWNGVGDSGESPSLGPRLQGHHRSSSSSSSMSGKSLSGKSSSGKGTSGKGSGAGGGGGGAVTGTGYRFHSSRSEGMLGLYDSRDGGQLGQPVPRGSAFMSAHQAAFDVGDHQRSIGVGGGGGGGGGVVVYSGGSSSLTGGGGGGGSDGLRELRYEGDGGIQHILSDDSDASAGE